MSSGHEADQPTYTAAEAARYVGTTPQTVGRWRRGYSYTTRGGKKRSKRLTAGALTGPLSFADLMEVAVVAAARKAHLSMATIRRAIATAEELYDFDRPLMQVKFKHDGREIFTHELEDDGSERIVNLSRRGQTAWKFIQDVLRDLDYDEDGTAYQWWPAGRAEPIVINPAVSFGRPYVYRRGVSTDAVLSRFRGGESLDEIADDYAMTVPEAEAALRYATLPLAA